MGTRKITEYVAMKPVTSLATKYVTIATVNSIQNYLTEALRTVKSETVNVGERMEAIKSVGHIIISKPSPDVLVNIDGMGTSAVGGSPTPARNHNPCVSYKPLELDSDSSIILNYSKPPPPRRNGPPQRVKS